MTSIGSNSEILSPGLSPLRKVKLSLKKQPTLEQQSIETVQNDSQVMESNSKVKVFIRLRPFLNHEDKSDCNVRINEQVNSHEQMFSCNLPSALIQLFANPNLCVIMCDQQNLVSISESNHSIEQTADKAFGDSSTQVYIFEQFLTPITSVLNGYNFTIFAYGQTGSGKTYTMFGCDWESLILRQEQSAAGKKQQQTFFDSLESDIDYAGIIPRTIYELFKQVAAKKEQQPDLQISVYCSFLQIYNEKIYDLLQESSLPKQLNVHESKLDGIFVEGLSEFEVLHYLDTLQLMKRGERNRAIRTTSMNAKSSRSHTIFQLIVETLDTSKDSGTIKRSRINLCDLAGSEKINKQEAMVGGHFNELRNINLSLTTLGKVIHNLSSNSKLPIPFRESKLTRILQESLSGNTITYIIANLSPVLSSIDDTVSTLKFAERARHITMTIKPNQISSKEDENLKKLQKEVLYLKEILNLRRKGQSVNDMHSKFLKLQEENEKLRKDHISIREVEKLIAENRKMKVEIQQIYMRQSMQKSNSMEESQFPMVLQPQNKQSEEANQQTMRSSISQSPVLNSSVMSTSNNTGNSLMSPLPVLKSKSSERISGPKSHFFPNVADQNSRSISLLNLRNNRSLFPSLAPLNLNNSRQSSFTLNNESFSQPDQIKNTNHTPVKIRIRGKQDYSTKSGFIEVSQSEVNQQEKQVKEKKRILERIEQLDRIQKFNQEKLQKELQIIEQIEQISNKHKKSNSSNIVNTSFTSKKPSSIQQEYSKVLAPLINKQKQHLLNYENKIKQLERKYFPSANR